MPQGCVCAIALLGAVMVLASNARAQSVISTHSGVVHFFEGDVYLDDRPLASHLGRFPTLPQGAELRTGEGRVEVLLTPGVFLLMDGRSAIREPLPGRQPHQKSVRTALRRTLRNASIAWRYSRLFDEFSIAHFGELYSGPPLKLSARCHGLADFADSPA